MWLMVAAVNIQEHDGISKKIVAQASALSDDNQDSYLICMFKGKTSLLRVNYNAEYVVVKQYAETSTTSNESLKYISDCKALAQVLSEICDEFSIGCCYIRHMMPSLRLIKTLNCLKRKAVKIVYEIPTYPYFAEQINEANSKIKTGIRLALEAFFWPSIYLNIDLLTVIRCRSNSWHLKKMLDIRNGSSTSEVLERKKIQNGKEFNIIGVGTIFKYHGYDRLIESIKTYNSKHEEKVKFYIVGESDEINRLKESQLCVGDCNFIFTGKKFGKDLENYYSIADLAVGTLSLNLRKADIDTALKNIEYISKDLPIVTSGKIFDIPEETGLYVNVGCSGTIHINELISFSRNYYNHDNYKLRKTIIARFSWKEIMHEVKAKVKS